MTDIALESAKIEMRILMQSALTVIIDELIRSKLMAAESLADALQVRADTHQSHLQDAPAEFLAALARHAKTFDARELGYRE